MAVNSFLNELPSSSSCGHDGPYARFVGRERELFVPFDVEAAQALVRLAETAPGLVSVRLIVADRPPTRSVAPFSRRFFGSDLRGNGYQALDDISKHLVVLDSRRQMEWDRVWRVRPDVVAEPVA